MDGVKFTEGLLKGLLHEDTSAIEQCATGGFDIISKMESAIHAFSRRDYFGVLEGMMIVREILKELPAELKDCQGIQE